MLNRIDLRGSDLSAPALRGLLPRAGLDVAAATEAVRPIVEAVREHGAAAIREATREFDGVDVPDPRVPAEALAAAEHALEPDVRAALAQAIARARLGHRAQRPTEVTTEIVPGGTVSQTWRPVERVGVYVPGGLAALVSSVVMNVVPAQIAGVDRIALASPARDGGLPDAGILAACALLGVEEVYAVGGAQAIAMFAYGGGDCAPVDLVTGPGNVYVTAAKRLVRGVVGIDSEAGTTEIAVVADDTADPVHVAVDLISQAEHDPNAASVLITPSTALLSTVEAELARRVPHTRHADRVTAALTGSQSAAILVDDVDAAVRVADAYAAEHLEIQTADARTVAGRIRNAGAIFIGPHSPVSLGDYCAGSNHVLPTGGCARHSAGLSVGTFLRSVQVIEYDEAALKSALPHVLALAHAEDLPAHGEAVSARFGA